MVSDRVVPILVATLGAVLLYTGWKRRRIHGRLSAVATVLGVAGPAAMLGFL